MVPTLAGRAVGDDLARRVRHLTLRFWSVMPNVVGMNLFYRLPRHTLRVPGRARPASVGCVVPPPWRGRGGSDENRVSIPSGTRPSVGGQHHSGTRATSLALPRRSDESEALTDRRLGTALQIPVGLAGDASRPLVSSRRPTGRSSRPSLTPHITGRGDGVRLGLGLIE